MSACSWMDGNSDHEVFTHFPLISSALFVQPLAEPLFNSSIISLYASQLLWQHQFQIYAPEHDMKKVCFIGQLQVTQTLSENRPFRQKDRVSLTKTRPKLTPKSLVSVQHNPHKKAESDLWPLVFRSVRCADERRDQGTALQGINVDSHKDNLTERLRNTQMD